MSGKTSNLSKEESGVYKHSGRRAGSRSGARTSEAKRERKKEKTAGGGVEKRRLPVKGRQTETKALDARKVAFVDGGSENVSQTRMKSTSILVGRKIV